MNTLQMSLNTYTFNSINIDLVDFLLFDAIINPRSFTTSQGQISFYITRPNWESSKRKSYYLFYFLEVNGIKSKVTIKNYDYFDFKTNDSVTKDYSIQKVSYKNEALGFITLDGVLEIKTQPLFEIYIEDEFDDVSNKERFLNILNGKSEKYFRWKNEYEKSIKTKKSTKSS